MQLRDSISAYEHLLSTAKGYRNALIALSTASTALAGALGECARVKGAEDTSAENLMAASGLQYMVANSGQVLVSHPRISYMLGRVAAADTTARKSDTLYRSFEVPLMTQYDSYVNEIAARHAEYEELLKEKTARIRETEAENMRRGKKKTRDLDQFRQALHQLTEQVAEVEVCKRTYYSEVLDGESQMWAMIAGKVALLVRSTLDLSDRLASKSTSDPVIESMLNEHPDPFDSYRLDRDEADVLTVLPPINLVGSASTPVISPGKSGNGTALATVLETEQSFQADADERDESERSALPQRLARTPVSVSDILGLREPDEASRPPRLAEALHEESPHNKQDAETPPRVGRSRSRSGSNLPTPSSTSTPNSTATESPALEHSLSRSESFDEPPSLTIESAPFVPPEHVAAVETPTKPVRSGPNESVDSEDPMAGDWGAPIYGRSLSMHDGPEYDSGDVSSQAPKDAGIG